ncbi:MAG: sulfotransferase family protein [Cellvibrionaceae bacterium]
MKKKLLLLMGVNPYGEGKSYSEIVVKIIRYIFSRISILMGVLLDRTGLKQYPSVDFFVIGAQKSGTTWLHSVLADLDEVGVSETKEYHFFDRGEGWFFSRYSKRYEQIGRRKVVGEFAPDYSALSYFDSLLFRFCYPRAKIFFVARNPYERALSESVMEVGQCGVLDVEEIDDDEVLRNIRSKRVVRRSSYDQIYDRWKSLYGSRFHFLFYDDLIESKSNFLLNILSKLDLQVGIDRLESIENYNSVVFSLSKPSLEGVCVESHRDFFRSIASKPTLEEGRTDIYRRWFLDEQE